MSKPNFTVAIVGGGIGGLTFALALSRARTDVVIDIYESAAKFSEFGAGLNLWPRVLEVLHSFDLAGDLREYTAVPGGEGKMHFRKADERTGIPWGETTANIQGIHRAELLKILVDHTTASCHSHFLKKLTSYVDLEDGPVVLHFADSTTATCDLLIGADGVKSGVRASMYDKMADELLKEGRPQDEVQSMRKHVQPTWSGCLIYRQLIAREDLEKLSPGHVSLNDPTFFQGKSRTLLSYPISNGRWINTAGIIARHDLYGTYYDGPWAVNVRSEELARHFVGWEDPAQILVKLMNNPTRWVVNTVDDLPTFVFRRTALLGDAAHSMTTYQAAGAMQAVEDGFVLAGLLSEPEIRHETISLALKAYDEVRRPIAQQVQRFSLHTGQTLLLEKMGDITAEASAAGLIPKERILKQGTDVQELYQWSSRTSAVPDRDRALEIFRSSLHSPEVPVINSRM